MEESQFWSMIESAWQAVGGKVKARRSLAKGRLSEERAEELAEAVKERRESCQNKARWPGL